MSQTIIELNQEDVNSQSVDNGDYTVNLQKPLVINKGDEIIMKSCFVDNRVINSNTIELKGDILPDGSRSNTQTITIGFGYYKTDLLGTWELSNIGQTTIYETSAVINTTDNLNIFTGRPFPAFEQINNPNNTLLEIVEIDMIMSNFGIASFENDTTNILKFPDSNGILKQYPITFDNDYLRKKRGTWTRDGNDLMLTLNEESLKQLRLEKVISFSDFPIIVKKEDNSKYIVPNTFAGGNTRDLIKTVITQAHTSTSGTYDIYSNEISFTLDTGFYDPDDIAQKMTEKIVNIEYGGRLGPEKYNISKNPLLKTIQAIRVDEGKELTFFDIDSTNNRKFQYDTNTAALSERLNYIIGSSQFGLSYNQGEDKMEILSIHNSLFNSRFFPKDYETEKQRGQPAINSTAPEVRIIRNKANAAQDAASLAKATKFVANKNSGIYLTKLEPQELWIGADSQFKFDSTIIPTYTKKTFVTVDSLGNSSTEIVYSPTELIEGQNITGDEAGLDEIIQKSISSTVTNNAFVNGFFQAFDIQRPVLPDTSIISDVIGSNTIIAKNKIGADILEEGAYYKVQVDMGIKNELLGNNNSNTISSIISKYYSQNSYTSSYSEGSIPYIHQSDEPLYISNIRIRILDPKNSLSENIGDRNSVFLEVVKSQ